MTRVRIIGIAALSIVLAAGTAFASWYDDYEAGLAAAQKGQWQNVVQKMSAAIKGNPKEDNKAREYGTIFINYHPYYYRGVAYLNTGKFEQAIADFEKTQGPGDTDLGSLDTLMQRAKTRLAEASAPAPEPQPAAPQPARPAPQPAAPAGPAIDPALRQRVAGAIGSANSALANARGRNATSSPQYSQAMGALAEANTKLNTAKDNDDLNAALASAQNAAMFADSAVAPSAAATATARPPAAAAAPVGHPKPVLAADAALSDYRSALRSALTDYFNGEFDDASRGFEQLTRAMPANPWIWAFLGASHYSKYAFEADENQKQAAVEAFRKAKASPHFRNGLPEKYFSKRIRKFFASLG